MNLSQAQYIIADIPLQGKVKTYQFQLNFTVLIPACAQGQIIRKLHIIWICSSQWKIGSEIFGCDLMKNPPSPSHLLAYPDLIILQKP